MKSLVCFLYVVCLLFGCKKEVLQSKTASVENPLTGTWQADYLGDKLSFEFAGRHCEMTIPYIVKKDATSAPQKGFIKLTGHYSQSSSPERLLQVDNLAAVNDISSSSVSSQDAWKIVKNLNIIVHNIDEVTSKDSLRIVWKDGKLSFSNHINLY